MTPGPRHRFAGFLLTCLGVVGYAALGMPPSPAPLDARLVVLVSIDQMRGDYLERFRDSWRGGFARLMTQGRVYPHALQDHAVTETAPGHATLTSGRHPAHTGIVSNRRGVPDANHPLVEGGAGGASPHRFRGTTLVDWLTAANPATRFLSVSRKDRSAILTIGRQKGPVFWAVNGEFTTSRYYADTLPDWVRRWNASRGAAKLAGTSWTLLLAESAYAEPDAVPYENGGRSVNFPHAIPADTEAAIRAVAGLPWMDSLTLDFALAGAGALRLGQGRAVDLLSVGLSATDDVGHQYGPSSRELHDHLLRVDRWLGWFLDSLHALVPSGRVVLVLSADHGVTPFPEALVRQGKPGGRVRTDTLLAALRAALAGRGGDRSIVEFDSGLLSADTARLRALGVDRDSLGAALAREWRRLPGVAQVFTPRSLAHATPGEVHAARWRNAIPPDQGWLLCVSLRPGYIWSNGVNSTTHGSTNPDDVTVPVAFLGEGMAPGILLDPIRTVDIAPTLADWLGVAPLEPLDGQPVKLH